MANSPRITSVGQVWKAIIGFLAPAAVVIGSGVAQAAAAGNAVNWWPDIIVTALVAAVVTGAGVYAKANEQPFGSAPPDDGNRINVPGPL